MARIYIARSTGIGSFERHVVLKMILPERAQDETSVQMFLDEARLAASLNHQNVAQVFEVGVEEGIHFLAMEYVHGQDLRALLARAGQSGTRVPLELALTVVAGAAAGLEHAHERRNVDGTPMGIVHRDVSPSNIMIGYDGAVKLLDFGIAKATSRSIETQSGIIKGKFAYMAPEQCRGRDVDRRSDVFSLGIILYEVTTQHRCFRADSDFDTMHRIVTGDVVRPSRLVQGYPQPLEAIVMRALAVDAGHRYQTAGLLLEALEQFSLASRMSLSTMSLGRFMRDMFGDVPEPWLQTGRFNPVEAKEQTISNTNASGEEPRLLPAAPVPRASSPSGPALQRPSSPSASGPALQRPSSASGPALQRPSSPSVSGPAQRPTPSASGPALRPPPPPPPSVPLRPTPSSLSPSPLPPSSPAVHGSPDDWASPPGSMRRSVSEGWSEAPGSFDSHALPLPPDHEEAPLHLPPELPFELPLELPLGMTERPAAPIASTLPGSTAHGKPIATASSPLHFTEGHRSESGPAHGALPRGSQPIVRTKPGYANAPATSRSEAYPRFDAHELDGNVSLQPSNRLLYLGLGVVLIGIIVLLAISIAEGPDELPPTSRASQSGLRSEPSRAAASAGAATLKPEAVKPEAFRAEAAGGDPAPSARRASIHLHVVSTPPGAEVSLSGKPIGTTPLDAETERRVGTEVLTIHRARYQDVTVAVDLGHDYDQTVILIPVAEPAAAKPAAERERPPARPAQRARPAAPSSDKDDCQPPDKINPFEKACHGKVCKPCPAQ
jgi:serine/threonine-protein kinase